MTSKKIRVLLTNDDGPPGPDSPYIYGLSKHMARNLGWEVKVVVPSSQKSWIGKAFHIKEIVKGRYYYPRDPGHLGGIGETSAVSRPLRSDRGEFAEWVLLDATPATCANIGLHNLYHGEIDLLISGPNLGRNSSAAFALSSGTIGAALSSSLCQVRSIALSYGTVKHPVPEHLYEPANELAGKIVQRLWDQWGKDDAGIRNKEVDLYNVNIPMIDALASNEGLQVAWTRMWRNGYGRLFSPHPLVYDADDPNPEMDPGGPDAPLSSGPLSDEGSLEGTKQPPARQTAQHAKELIFKFAPDMHGIVHPDLSTLPVGCDAWALAKGWASVTPLRASFAEPPGQEPENVSATEDEFALDSSSGHEDRVKLFKL